MVLGIGTWPNDHYRRQSVCSPIGWVVPPDELFCGEASYTQVVPLLWTPAWVYEGFVDPHALAADYLHISGGKRLRPRPQCLVVEPRHVPGVPRRRLAPGSTASDRWPLHAYTVGPQIQHKIIVDKQYTCCQLYDNSHHSAFYVRTPNRSTPPH